MFQDEDTPQIHRAMGSIDHPCSTIQGSAQYLSLMRPGPFSITFLAIPVWLYCIEQQLDKNLPICYNFNLECK